MGCAMGRQYCFGASFYGHIGAAHTLVNAVKTNEVNKVAQPKPTPLYYLLRLENLRLWKFV